MPDGKEKHYSKNPSSGKMEEYKGAEHGERVPMKHDDDVHIQRKNAHEARVNEHHGAVIHSKPTTFK